MRYYFTTGRVFTGCHYCALPIAGYQGWNGLPKPCQSGAQKRRSLRELQCTSIRVPHVGALSCDWTTRHSEWWPARVTRPVLRIKSPLHHFNACRPNGARGRSGPPRSCKMVSQIKLFAFASAGHLHWRRSRRRASALGYASKMEWSLLPVLPRQEFFTKEIRRLLYGGEMVAILSAALGEAGL